MKQPSIFHIRENGFSNRIELLDFLRGIGMLLVLIHHSDLPNGYGRWILAFHMPFMFLLSGYTMYLRPHITRFPQFLRGRFLRLIVPYFLFEGCNLLVWSASLFLQGGWQDVTDAVYAVFACLNTDGYTGYYGRLWFWPCMFVSDLFFYCILHCAPSKKKVSETIYLFIMILVMFSLSWYTCNRLPARLPFTIDTACMATGFLLTGYLLGQQITWILRKKHLLADILILVTSLLIMRWAILSGKTYFMMFINAYGSHFHALCGAYSGIFAFLILAKWIYDILRRADFLRSFVLWYGYHSFVTFPVHLSIKIFIYQMFPLSYRQWYILLPSMLLLNVPLVNLITKYFPFLLGKLSLPDRKKSSF